MKLAITTIPKCWLVVLVYKKKTARPFYSRIDAWMHDVSSTNSSISQYYRLFKKSFNTEDYLTQLSGQNKCIFTKLRLSLLKFPVTPGRYDDIPYEQRYCTFCDEHLIGDEFHYILVCKNFNDLRNEYIPEYFWEVSQQTEASHPFEFER